MYDHLIGKRIRLLRMRADPSFGKTLFEGDLGTIESINTVKMSPRLFTQIWVKFDNGSFIALLMDIDNFEVV